MSRWPVNETFEVLKGKTITEIHGDEGSEELLFDTEDGETYKMYHSQDCCESVGIEEIIGDLKDLIGSPILLAEEITNADEPEEFTAKRSYPPESATWTFYKLSTIKGSVTIRWIGESNGYYSESVDFVRM